MAVLWSAIPSGAIAELDPVTFDACLTGPAIPYDPQNLPPGCGLIPDAQGFIAADFDKDGDVDQDDFGVLQRSRTVEPGPLTLEVLENCLTGPAVPYDPLSLAVGCDLVPNWRGRIAADLDADGDVDQDDFGIFQRARNGDTVECLVSTTAMDFGATATELAFEVWNAGGQQLVYSVSSDASWLAVMPALAEADDQRFTHVVSVDRSTLPLGSYQGTVTVTPNAGNPWTLTVTMQVACPDNASLIVPMARWDVVPYQRVNRGSPFNCGVVAFSKDGIDRVRFTISGQGYFGPSPVDVTEMTLNDQTGVYEYWMAIDASYFASDGPFAVEATVFGRGGCIRDKTTDGGGLGLDTLSLVANATGTLSQPEAWVSSIAGDDAAGRVNDSSAPFATIGRAIDAIRLYRCARQLGNNADGGIVRLMPGSHVCSSGGVANAVSCDNEWLTITADAGGTRDGTILLPGDIPATRKICARGITLSGGGTLGMNAAARAQAFFWIDNCVLIGAGRTAALPHPLSDGYAGLYYTGCSITQVQQATTGARLCRGLTITAISDDAFQNNPLVVDCTVDDIDPLDTGNHADLFQHGGGNALNHVDDNVIVYNLKGTHLAYQGVFVNGDSSAEPAKARGMAFVNVFVQMNSDSHNSCMWYRWVDHLLWWHCTIIRNAADPYGMQIFAPSINGVVYPTQISNFSVVGCDFERLTGADSGFIDTTGWAHNHFVSTLWDGLVIGADATTGPDLLDAEGVPQADSPLVGRVASPVVPADIRNRPRLPAGDIGAFQR